MNYIILLAEVVGIIILAYSSSVVKNLFPSKNEVASRKSYLAVSGMQSYFTSPKMDSANEIYKYIPKQKMLEDQQIHNNESSNYDALVFDYKVPDYRFEYKRITNRMTAVKYTGVEE